MVYDLFLGPKRKNSFSFLFSFFRVCGHFFSWPHQITTNPVPLEAKWLWHFLIGVIIEIQRNIIEVTPIPNWGLETLVGKFLWHDYFSTYSPDCNGTCAIKSRVATTFQICGHHRNSEKYHRGYTCFMLGPQNPLEKFLRHNFLFLY